MLNSFTFPSIMNPEKHGYVVDATSKYETTRNGCAAWAKFFDTYGDGPVQHSMETSFAVDMLPDFLASLSIYLAEQSAERRDECLALLAKQWPTTRYAREQVAFALSIKAKEKTFYYNLAERKTSTADSKSYDKRWEVVRSYDDHVDGSLKSAAIILRTGDCSDRIGCIASWLEIAAEHEGYHANDIFAEQLRVSDGESRRMAIDCRQAWEIVAGFVSAYRQSDWAKGAADCLKHNLGNRKTVAADVA